MPHAALWVVQPEKSRGGRRRRGFQCRTRLCGWCSRYRRRREMFSILVSMPHAALWVVQQSFRKNTSRRSQGFNAARGFVGGAAANVYAFLHVFLCFNAARGFVGGAA